jgi:predicted lipid-binding transport protein (Tim44 family)
MVFDGFMGAVDARAARKETIEQSFVGIKGAEITHANLQGQQAHVTVRFVSDLISSTRNMVGEVISGDPKRVKEVTDIWTFVRDVSAKTPNWHLDATEAAT